MTTEQRLPPTELGAAERRELLEQTDQELREIEDEMTRLLIRKRLLLLLRQCLTNTAGVEA